jgi:large subunit ribosomal protein L3
MVTGIIGKKVGMTQVFGPDGTVVPVTVLKAGPCVVVQAKGAQREGYEAVQLGLVEQRPARVNAPKAGHFKKAGVPPTRVLRELRVKAGGEALKAGDQVLVTMFNPGERVDVIGTSKGRGFQGVVRRHHYKGGPETHGCKTHDMPGSIGASAWPSRVIKGRRLPGHMGMARNTVRNLTVVKIDPERHLLLVRGAVPGARNSLVVVRKRASARKDG